MKFDTHAHIFLKNIGIKDARYIPNYSISKDDFMAQMHSFGFSGGVLIQPSFLGYDNSLLLQAIANDLNLRGVAVLPFTTDSKLLESYAKRGIVGIRLNLIGKDVKETLKSLQSTQAKAFFDSIKSLDWHVEVHKEMNELNSIIESLLGFDVKIVIDHLGRPNKDYEGLERLLSFKDECKLWFKLSGFYRFGGDELENIGIAQHVYKRLKEAFGVERFVFGSDFPHTNFEKAMSYEQSFKAFLQIVPDSKEQEMILGVNAKELFLL